MGDTKDVLDLHIPSQALTSLETFGDSNNFPIAQRRTLRNRRSVSFVPFQEQVPKVSMGNAELGKSKYAYLDTKPLPSVPSEKLSSNMDVGNESKTGPSNSLNAPSKLPLSSSSSKAHGSMAAAGRTISRVFSLKRHKKRDQKPNTTAVTRPADYVDKGTQTSLSDLPTALATSHASTHQAKPGHSALKQYQAGFRNMADVNSKNNGRRPNIRSLQSFLNFTSPSAPGTPTPATHQSSTLEPKRRTSVASMPSHSSEGSNNSGLETLPEEYYTGKVDIKKPDPSPDQTSERQSVETGGTYYSRYSERTPLRNLVGGSAFNNDPQGQQDERAIRNPESSRPASAFRVNSDSQLASVDSEQSSTAMPASYAR